MAQQTPAGTVKTDGRKRRWHQHKVERRNELIDGTIDAIRHRGQYVSMDEIAGEIGVSKTVLYRYFVDKNDLTTAVMMRFAQITLIPNMAKALSTKLDGYELTREVIRVYVDTVSDLPVHLDHHRDVLRPGELGVVLRPRLRVQTSTVTVA